MPRSRIHRVSHPVLGPATWAEILAERRGHGRVCSWCFGPVPKGSRTRCSAHCAEMIWRAYSPGRATLAAIKRDKATCVLCGNHWCMIEVDHIVPVCLGGLGDIDNLRCLCSACHKVETARLRREAGAYIATGVDSCN